MSIDGMTADYYPFEHSFLARVANHIINEVQGINRVTYDIMSKPPATIEWESKFEAQSMQGEKLTLEKWMQCRIAAGREPAAEIVDDFERVLGDAKDERPLQTFLASFPTLLAPLAPPGGAAWCLDRPRFGSEFVPDFLMASTTSVGFRWAMIELESPNEKALTKAGLPAKKLAEALKQIRDWRTWLTDNVAYARTELGLKDIEAICPAYIVIGRRGSLDPKQIKAYRALSTDGMTIMSYDRLLEQMARAARGRLAKHGQ